MKRRNSTRFSGALLVFGLVLGCSSGSDDGDEGGTGGAPPVGAGGMSAGGDALGPGGAAPGGASGTSPIEPSCTDPFDLGVHLVGRYDACNEDGVRMSWSGTGFVARFSGTGLDVTVDDPGNYYTVLVDGEIGDTLATDSSEEAYELASGLESGEHEVELYRRTEASQNAATFLSVNAIDGELLSPPEPPERLIEIIGDSITCGYGNEGPDTSCTFSPDTENHYLSYGAVLARQFDAELSTVAWSGKGVVSNYDGNLLNPLPALYERAVPNDSESRWGFEPQPDAVIINLGTNDYSTNNDPTDTDFVAGYVALLKTIRRHYPDAFILCTVGPMLSGSDLAKAERNIASAAEQRQDEGDADVIAYEMTTGNPSPACDWHPSLDTHAAMADELGGVLASALGW